MYVQQAGKNTYEDHTVGLVGHAKERKRDRKPGTPATKHDLLAVPSDRDVGALVGNGRATAANGRSGVLAA